VHQAVTPAEDQRLDPVCHAASGEVERLVAVATLEVAHHEPALAEPGQGDVAVAGARAPARGRVGQQGDLATPDGDVLL
jgi:hypothetical protein